ncbi:hypothetical protein DRO69_04195, partial [Candidatus Bathyarchaeota archaeon]
MSVKMKKYSVTFIILLMTLSSLAIINIHVKPAQAPPLRNLTVQSTPIDGINFTINGTSYTTNTTANLDVGTSNVFNVTMPKTWMNGTDKYTFIRWEDNSTNPVRIITLQSDTTIIAFYAHVKVYVNQPQGYIPGVPEGTHFQIDIMIETNGFVDFGTPSICGWSVDLQVNPDVISINTTAPSPPPFPPPPPDAKIIGSEAGYVMYDYDQLLGSPNPPALLPGTAYPTTGYWDEITEIFVPMPSTGFGDYMTQTYYGGPAPLVTIEVTSKNETAYSLIDLLDVKWVDGNNKWHDVDNVIDGHYNPPPPNYTLTVESTPIDGINFTIGTTTYTTNTTVELQKGTYTVTMPSTWTVGADQYNFVKWENNSTNPLRTIDLTSNKTIIATYERALENYTLTVNSVPIDGIDFTINGTSYTTN